MRPYRLLGLMVKCAVYGAAILLTTDPIVAQEPFPVPECDQLLGNGYEQLSGHEKQARLAMYGGCWKRSADAVVKQRYNDIVRDVTAFKGSAVTVANSQIAARAQTAREILATSHETEIRALSERFDEEFRSIALQTTPENRHEMAVLRNEATQRQRAELLALQLQQSSEVADLDGEISDAYVVAAQRIAELVQADLDELARQLSEKLRFLLAWHDAFVNTPPEQSMGEYLAQQPIGRIEEISGDVRVVRPNGQQIEARSGEPIRMGDTVRTGTSGAANIRFADDTTFAVSEDADIEIDEYVYDPNASAGDSDFTVLRAIFVFTSGLIGRDDSDDALIETPVGTIGIRG